MNKILFLVVFVLGFITVNAQTPVIINQPYNFRTTINVKDSIRAARGFYDSTLMYPPGCGSPSGIISLHGGNKKMPALYYDTCNHRMYNWDPILMRWLTAGSATQLNDSMFIVGNDTIKIKNAGGTAYLKNRYSIVKSTSDSLLQLNNDLAAPPDSARTYQYAFDRATGIRGYKEDKYIICKTHAEIRTLKIPDTTYAIRLRFKHRVIDYYYDPNDVSTTDDTLMTIVTAQGYRYKRFIADGIFDAKDFGAVADGSNDDTWFIQQTLLAASKYTGNNGTTIRLNGYYKFDPTNFIYPTGRGLVFEITGNVQLLNTWRIPKGVSIVGKGGATAEASFDWSTIASIQYTVSNSGAPKAAIELTYGGNTLRNLTIGSYGGIGVKLNGTFFIPAALALLENVSVNVGSYTGKQTGLLISDWFWFKLENSSFSVDGTSAAGSSSIKMEGKTYYPDINLCYLGEFNNCTVQGRPIRIQAGDTADNSLNVGIVNISFHNLTIENVSPDTAAVILNSTKIPIDNIIFERPVMVDTYGMGSFIYNYGNNTTGVKIHDGDLLSGQLKKIFNGAAIRNKGFSSTAVAMNNFMYNPGSRQLFDNTNVNGYADHIDINRGWKGAVELQLYDGGQIANTARKLKDSVIASAATVSAAYTAYNGDTLAIKVTPDGTNSNPTIKVKEIEKVWHTGDKIYFGAWVKSDNMDSIFSTALKAVLNGGNVWNGTSAGTISSDINYISTPNNGWRFLILTGKVDASLSDHGSYKLYLYVNSNDTNQLHPYYVSHPFVYSIDSTIAVNINDNEFLSWIKENAGGLYQVPSKSYGIRDDLPFYIGDSTRFLKGILQRMDGTGAWAPVGAGSISLGTIGSSPNGNGATYIGGVLALQPANGTYGGVLTNGAQTIAGSKTFNDELIISGNTANTPTGLFGAMNVQSFANTNGFIANNSYYDNSSSGYKYLNNGEACQFHFVSGDIRFENAVSGSAGAIATMGENMRVTAGGEVWTNGALSVGSLASPTWKLDVNGPIRTKGTAGFISNDRSTNLESVMFYSLNPGEADIYDWVNGVDRFKFKSTGQFQMINYGSGSFTGTPTYKLSVDASGYAIETPVVDLIKYQHSIFTPSTGGTVNLVNGQYNIINPSGTIATLTVNLPSSPSNNDVVYIKYTQAVTTVTYANGTVVDGITAPSIGQLVVLTYDSGTSSWY